MGLVIDSSVLIAAERGCFDIESFIEAEAAMEPLYLSMITASELLHGVHRSTEEHRGKRQAFVESVLSGTPLLEFDLASARKHAALWAKLEDQGQRIGAHDMLIAATCLAYGQRLATLNEREFERVEGLRLVETTSYWIPSSD